MSQPTKKTRESSSPERRLRSLDLPGCKPGEWDEGLALRETFLMYYADEPADFLRWLAKRHASWLFEKDLALDPSYRGSRAKAFLGAAMLDLQYITQFLAYTAREAVEEEASPSEVEHGWFADSLAVEVRRLVDKIDARINPRRKAKKDV